MRRFKSVFPCGLLWCAAALLLRLSQASAATVGPDAAGYVATDATTFAFENITNTGTRVLAHADVSATNANLGFTFTFYGKAFTNLYFGHNGLISFGNTNFSYNNVNLTNAGVNPDLPSIAVLWDDWITTNATADAVYYQTLGSPGSRRFVVQWNNIYGYPASPNGVTFEATLFEASGDILFQYLDVFSGDGRDNGASATVGIRDTAGQTSGRSLQWSFNGSPRGVTNSEAIRFSAACIPPVVLNPFPASMTQSFEADGVHITVCANVQGTAPFNYSWSTNGNFAFNTDSNCATFVFSPIDENSTVSVQVGNNCGGGGGGGPVTIGCGVCLSRGTPNVLSSTTGSATGPPLSNQSANCTVGSTAKWFKMIATNDSGLVTISTEGSTTDTILAVYTGPLDSPASLIPIACNDNISSSNSLSRVSFQATQGTVYWLIVDPRTTSTALKLSYGFEPKIATFSYTTNRVFTLTSTIAPAIRYRVQAATNLSSISTNWTTVLTTNITTNYPYVFFRETNAATINRRFYRLAPGY